MNRFSMRPRYRPKVRRRGKRQFWSRLGRKTFRHHVHVFHLPTRNTMTVAEAQRFVDVETDGSVHRLDVSVPILIVSNMSCNGDDESPDFCELSQNLSAGHCQMLKADKVSESDESSRLRNCFQPHVRIVEQQQQQKEQVEEFQLPSAYCRRVEETVEKLDEEVEYDMDEQDSLWLGLLNESRRAEKLAPVTPNSFEYVIDRFEKESFASSLVPKPSNSVENVGRRVTEPCAVCLDSESQQSNLLISCDSCSMTVHQDCYGIPYVPDGTWICRTCLRCSPTTALKCCLCPVAGGAQKQTDDGQFAHVICARWIPEVKFGSAVYLEPIEHISKVPSWRRRLTCAVCGSNGTGACIRCEMPRCDTAFHVTCAQQAGTYMRLEIPRGASNCSRAAPPRRTIFCDLHRPVETDPAATLSLDASSGGTKSGPNSPLKLADSLKTTKKARKSAVDEIAKSPRGSSVFIHPRRLLGIADSLRFRDRHQLISRLHSYWLLKRQVQRGVPLLDRLKYYSLYKSRVAVGSVNSGVGVCLNESNLDYLKRLRHSMDQVRRLLELICEREKMKKEWMVVHEGAINLQLQPLQILLHHTLDQLQARDSAGVFAYPVPFDEVPDYLEKISQPMDFSTMRGRIDSHHYHTIDQFEDDFQLMINNCLTYNEPGSVLYRIGLKLQRECNSIISAARRMSERAGYCQQTGLHLPSAPLSITLDLPNIHQVFDSKTSCQSPAGVSLEDQLKNLLRRLDVLQVVRTHRNAYKCRKLRRRISVVKRQLTYQKQEMMGLKSPYRSPGRRPGKARSPASQMYSASSRRSFSGRLIPTTSPQLRCKISRRRLSLSPPTLGCQPTGQSRLVSPSLKRQAFSQPLSAQIRNKRIPSDDSAVTCSSTELVNGLTKAAVETSSHREAVCSPVLASHKTEEQPPLVNGYRRKLSESESIVTSSPAHPRSSRKRLAPVPMQSKGEMGAQSLAEAAENDSSYESSYSVMSDSDLSNDVNGLSGVNSGSVPQHLQSVGQVKAKATRSTCSIDADDITTPLHKGDVVWARRKDHTWYPAVVVRIPDSGNSSRKNGLSSTGFTALPVPSSEILTMQFIYAEPVYLVCFFDKQHDWQWLPRRKLEPLGQNASQDTAKISQVKQWKSRATVQAAFNEAVKCRFR